MNEQVKKKLPLSKLAVTALVLCIVAAAATIFAWLCYASAMEVVRNSAQGQTGVIGAFASAFAGALGGAVMLAIWIFAAGCGGAVSIAGIIVGAAGIKRRAVTRGFAIAVVAVAVCSAALAACVASFFVLFFSSF